MYSHCISHFISHHVFVEKKNVTNKYKLLKSGALFQNSEIVKYSCENK